MKKYIKFWAFAIMAVFSLVFISCGDEDDVDEIVKEDYTFTINGETFYYGKTDELGSWIYAGYDLNMDYNELDNEWCSFVIEAQDVPYPSWSEMVDDDGNWIAINDPNYHVSIKFGFKKFDPKELKKGDELEFYQIIGSFNNDPKYLRDMFNEIKITDKKQDFKIYTWKKPVVGKGKVKFVSYGDRPNSTFKLLNY